MCFMQCYVHIPKIIVSNSHLFTSKWFTTGFHSTTVGREFCPKQMVLTCSVWKLLPCFQRTILWRTQLKWIFKIRQPVLIYIRRPPNQSNVGIANYICTLTRHETMLLNRSKDWFCAWAISFKYSEGDAFTGILKKTRLCDHFAL